MINNSKKAIPTILYNQNNAKLINSRINFITGCARSGTTIIGNIIASFNGSDYFFEPDSFRSIIFLKKKINKHLWKLTFETYLYHDLIKSSLRARRMSMNKNDDSYFFKVKKKSDLNIKLKSNFDLHEKIIKKLPKFFIKEPCMISEILDLKKKYPSFKIILVDRDPIEIVASLSKKKWFSNKIERYYPLIKHKSSYFPFWLHKNYYVEWKNLNIYERSALYTIKMRKIISKEKNVIKLNYNSLLEDPKKFVFRLSKKLNLKPTKKTYKLIKSLYKNRNDLGYVKKSIRKSILSKLLKN